MISIKEKKRPKYYSVTCICCKLLNRAQCCK